MNSELNRRRFLRATGAATLAAATVPSALADSSPSVVVALVGCAHIHTENYVDDLKKRKDVRVKSVWDHDADRAQKYAKILGAKAVAEPAEVWSDPEIKAVVICSETNRHRDLVLAAAKAGQHLFVEKPMGVNGAESLEMAKAIEGANLIFTTGYFMRAEPAHIFLQSEIAKGHFGTITRVRGSNCHAGTFKGYFNSEFRWMADPKIAGVGAYGDLGTHKLDILMWLIGDIGSVTADVRPVTGQFGDCDETGEGLIQFKNGVIGTLGAGWVDVQDPVQLIISGTAAHAAMVNGKLYYKNANVEGANGTSPFHALPKKLPEPLYQFLDAVNGKRSTQGQFVALAHNLLLLYEQRIQREHGVSNTAEDNRRARRQSELARDAGLMGRAIPTLLLTARTTTQRSVKFIRWLRHAIRERLAEEVALPRLRQLYAHL